ncbi:hypothetical protein BpHYR1_029307 [Brachionus plicatilis]|uniref:SWIM-type domain-containing protein n=1 Tax=Brachionus plicatilis TaxID=10195 RepID=A0A3M7PAU6_BRAPC|nr:hypothetical protein BpHYR1_029307 [Brachionus plicatilis]
MCKDRVEWFSFDDYINEINSFRFVRFNQEEWESSVCLFPDRDKNLICKHVIGAAYRLKLCEYPDLDLNLEANKKRATLALVQSISTGPINPAELSFNYEFPVSLAQSINLDPLSNENDNDQVQAESINNDIQTIVRPTTSSNLSPRKRRRPRKNP